ncbi:MULTISPECIES: hypothetical protein [unclassified Microbacterium]|uniref:hypothetical protein n=1 Tax=unclassified Microbacterium TaxID=2609290 RepID=UPI000CFB8C42|nr:MULTISPECIES: hypothetical protein [unclassified Microbacterium]PQZ54085.1 hypothetical protein CQ032_14025 [Microbacterium sp. MYb43]PQZ81566.1 hypothetical protein CQ031_04920 [Microbacterium sp. MYb40]PRB21548.1 hypothetical protein CQ040_09315 [Microbacterium sp. MYb54]PRB30113.1 hypothetical protein CQ037_06935 [Microbacterium sp. MYb50]PRB67729.1 hypothetical protein CQ021_07040 [Microbacterium sp. MYb24]
MLGADEVEELRSLQARAYGRDAALTEAEALRLDDLEGRRFVPAAASVDTTTPLDSATPLDVASSPATARLPGEGAGELRGVEAEHRQDDAAESFAAADAGSSTAGGDTRDPVETVRSLLRAHWRPAVLVAAALVVVGAGVGWMLFGRSGPAPVALSAQQQEWQGALLAGDLYDQGSVRALAVEQGAVIWTATKDDGERTCLLVAKSASALPNCELTETVEKTGLFGAVTLESSDEVRRELNVQMMFTASGEPAVAARTEEYGPGTTNGVMYANAEEAEKAKRIAAQGFEINSLWVIGYDGEVPVWTGMEVKGFQTCLIYDGSDEQFPRVCADALTMQEQSATLVLNVVDDESGDVTRLELPTASNGSSSLMVTRVGGADDAARE